MLRWSGGQACDDSSIVGHVDVQHRSVCGSWDHGDSWSGVSDPPGQNKQEEEGRAQTTTERYVCVCLSVNLIENSANS